MEQLAARRVHAPQVAGSSPAPASMADELDSTIQENASGPKRARGDSGEMEQHSLTDQIAADKYLAEKNARENPAKGFTRVKIVPPGTV